MATFDFPSALKPAAATVQLNRMAQTFRSPFGGSPQVGDVLSERWQLALFIPPALLASSGAAESLTTRLAGGYNRVRVHHPVRPIPRGSLHGEPTLESGVAAGADSISIEGGLGTNFCPYSSLELDSNADGMADGWSAYTLGTTGTITYGSAGSSGHGSRSQFVRGDGLAGTVDDRVGIERTVYIDGSAAQAITVAADIKASSAVTVRLFVRVFNGGTLVSQLAQDYPSGGTSLWIRDVITVTPGAAFDRINLYIFCHTGTGAAATIFVDNVQVENGSEATDYEPAGGSLEAGDIVGLNGQWLQVAETALADDAGVLTFDLVNRLRNAVTAGADVEWDHPTVEMAASGNVGSVSYAVGASEGLALDLEEVW